MLGEAARYRSSPADLAVAAEEVFVSGEFLEGHGAAGVEFVGGDADFRAEAEFAAVGESGAGVPIDGGAVHLGEEVRGGGGAVLRAVERPVKIDEVHRLTGDPGRNDGPAFTA